MKYYITADCHRDIIPRLQKFKALYPELDPDNVCIIFLGDFGINLGNRSYANDQNLKEAVSKYGYHLLICRGNHEQRCSQVPNMERVYDEELQGYVWQEEDFPLIKFFDDVPGEYIINGYSVLVIPGGFSIDKDFRVATGRYWNPEEMLTQEEMNAFKPSKKHYDFIFSHILPLRFLPYDLFLPFIDQSKVDYSMENWYDNLLNEITYDVLCCGHYHHDRYERPHVEQFFQHFDTLEAIAARWKYWDETHTLENPYVEKSHWFYEGEKDGNS